MSTQGPSPFLAEGEERLAVEDWDGAVAAFQKAVAAAPSSALAHSKLGVAYVHKRQWDDAQASFSKAIQLDPRYAPAHSNLGNVYRERGRLDEAVACYQKAVAMDPDYWIAHQNLGIVYKQQGRVGEAVREFKTATRLSLRAGTRSSRMDAPLKGAGAARSGRTGCLGTGTMTVLLLVAAALWTRW
ncbi:MAG TPA: tetratricopeptide repeat protein [bacterium]|nr:tetratricopeptide repeat protein [bacterium]